MPLRETLTNSWDHIQGFLFPALRVEVGPLTAQHERFVVVLEIACIGAFVQVWPGMPGRPPREGGHQEIVMPWRVLLLPRLCSIFRRRRV